MKTRMITGLALLAAAVAVVACLRMVVRKDSTINVLIVVLLYVVFASSWNIVGGFAGQSNLGRAALSGVGFLVTRLL